MPNLYHSNTHSWFLTDSSITILTINPKSIQDDQSLILFEIDLMTAAGFTLVLCSILNHFTYKLIKRNQFSEIHINLMNSDTI